MHRVSVIVPTHNRAAFLPAHLDCMLDQSHTNYEAIYVNDSSNDGTADVLDEYAKRYPDKLRVVSAAYGAPGPTRNAGARAASGNMFLFTDDDVLVPRNWIQGMSECFAEHRTDALCGGIAPRSMKTPIERYMHYRVQRALGKSPRSIAAAPMMNFMVTRDTFEHVGGFLEDPLRAAEDWEFCYRLTQSGAHIMYDARIEVVHTYQHDDAPAIQRMRDAGAAGVRIWRKHHRGALLYTLFSVIRSGAAPLWAPIWYPLDLYSIAVRMEFEFARARAIAYWRPSPG